MNNSKYLAAFFEEISLPSEAADAAYAVEAALFADEISLTLCEKIKESFFDSSVSGSAIQNEIRKIAENLLLSQYILAFYLLSSATEKLKEKYRERGISEEMISDTLYDFCVKCRECYETIGEWGFYNLSWNLSFFRKEIYAFGRLQIELTKFSASEATIGGKTICKGDPVLFIHIPRSEKPFDDEARLSSYRASYAFFKSSFPDEKIPYVCSSWLLYPYNKEILSEKSNVIRFSNEFKLISTAESDSWLRFIFGVIYDGNPENLPEKSSLHKAYKNHYRNGGRAGSGYGIFLFDGENIINE